MVVTHPTNLGPDETAQVPRTIAARDAEYDRREAVADGAPYSTRDIVALNLFVAIDPDGNRTATTRRVDPLLRFVCSVDAALIATTGLVVRGHRPDDVDDPSAGQSMADGEAASAVWRRSQAPRLLHAWATRYVVRGDAVWEAQLHPDGARIVAHHPQHVRIRRDATGLDIVEAVIEFSYPGEDGLDVEYKRILTPTTIVTVDNGTRVEVPNPLGRVPLATARFGALVGTDAIGSWAGHGLEAAVAMLDSATCQISTVGSRHANPMLITAGVRTDGSDVSGVGNILAIPSGADVSWLEATLGGLEAIGAARASLREQVERLVPELLFVDAGASSSGTALSYRASALVLRIDPPRQAFYGALAEALSYAVALDQASGEAARSTLRRLIDTEGIVVDGGPVLPGDTAALAEMIRGLTDGALITRTTATTMLQGAGLVEASADPAAYAAQAQADADAAAARASLAMQDVAGALERAAAAGSGSTTA